jgi:hypothetical protein
MDHVMSFHRSLFSGAAVRALAIPRLIALGFVAIGAGVYFGWGWLVAVGLAPILVSLAPCLLMCALGICVAQRRSVGNAKDPTTPEVEQ